MRSLALRNIFPGPGAKMILSDLISFRSSRDEPLQTLYLDKESIHRMSQLQWFHDLGVEVVALDTWSVLRRDSLLCDPEDSRFYPEH
jgi:hypothetical protein